MKKKLAFCALFSALGIAISGYASAESTSFSQSEKFAYLTGFTDINEYRKAGSALNAELTGEGMVLLKNAMSGRSATLPLSGVKKVSVFGKNSVDLQYGGGGSGSDLRWDGRNPDEEEDAYRRRCLLQASKMVSSNGIKRKR